MNRSLIASSLLGVALALTACSGEMSESGIGSTPVQLGVASPPDATDSGVTNIDSTGIGDDPSTWAPVLVTSGTSTITLVSGQSAAFADYEYDATTPDTQYLITSTKESVATLIARDDSMVPSFTAGMSGEAVITVSTYTGDTPTLGTTVMLEQVRVIVE